VSSGAPPPGPPPDDAPTLYQTDAPPPDPGAPPPRRRVWPPDRDLWPWLVLLLLVVVGGVIAAILLSGGNGNKKHAGPGTGTIVNTKPGTVLVPAVVGMTQAHATRRLQGLGLNVQARAQTGREAAGIVLAQSPKAGTRLPRGRLVGIVVSSGPPKTAVPNVVGMTAADAAAKLQGTGLHATTKKAFSPKPAGTVIAEKPPAGSELTRGASVALTVSRGPARVTVPDVTGLPRAQAAQKVRAAGLTPNAVAVPSTETAGRVVSQSPGGGSSAASGSIVRLNVAKGSTPGGGGKAKPARVTVPNVVGKQQAGAQQTLVRAGLRSRVTYVTSQQPRGTVIAQSPRAGATAKRNVRVALKVSTGPSAPQQAAVPNVVGEEQATARSDLESAGFQVQVVEQETADPSQDGIVIDQDPAGGTQAPQGATVTIVVGRSPG
jgi:beta-lactam-binding protein with PASTA domain